MGRKRPWADRHDEFGAELIAIQDRPQQLRNADPWEQLGVLSRDAARLSAALGVALNLHQPRNRWLFRPVCRGCDQYWPCDEYTEIRDKILGGSSKAET